MTDYSRFLSPTGRQLTESAIRRMGTVVARAADMVSFAPGYPDASLFPGRNCATSAPACSTGTMRTRCSTARRVATSRCSSPHCGCSSAGRVHATLEQLIVTSGSQQGIDLIARVLVSPGDVVLVELPTFTGAIAAFKNVQAELVGVRLEADGISLEHLDEMWQQATRAGQAPSSCCTWCPTFRTRPDRSSAWTSAAQVLEWAERRDVLIVEDDPYGLLYFEDVATEAETRPICADDRNGRVLYLSTVSKMLAPGFRVGWMKAPEMLIERFDTAKQSTDLTSGILDQHIVHEALRLGVADRLAPRLRDLYRHKRDVMAQCARRATGLAADLADAEGRLLHLGHAAGRSAPMPICWSEPSSTAWSSWSAAPSTLMASGHDTIRLSFSAPSPERIEEGARRLADAFRSPDAFGTLGPWRVGSWAPREAPGSAARPGSA